MSSADPLAVLQIGQRNELESLLMEFDQEWTAGSLQEFVERLGSHENRRFRELAIGELVKVDLQRDWSSGDGRLLEDYLDRFPELGNRQTVAPELILAEFEARRLAHPRHALSGYEARFPAQYEQVRRLASELIRSGADAGAEGDASSGTCDSTPAQASVDTSRVDRPRDTKVGASRTAAPDLPVEFGRYRILRELGAGAMGKVYLAHDSQLDRQVALKTPSFRSSDSDDLVTRFYREARSAAKIQHRNICPVYDVGKIDGRHFISMAFVRGRCLSEFVKPEQLPPQRTSAILVQRLAAALAEAHRHNVVHRDLKPANIMIDLKKEPVVMDFGLARQTDAESRVTQSGVAVGTPAYMSPEQVSGDPDQIGCASDIYSLGVILYELLTGRLPFRGPIAKVVYGIVHDNPTAPSAIRKGIDPELESICTKMMAKNLEERYRSMDEVAAELKSYVRHQNRPQRDGNPSTKVSASPTKSVSDSGETRLSETGALNAFFAARAEEQAGGTMVESAPRITPAAKSSPVGANRPRPSAGRSGGRNRRRWAAMAAGYAGGFLVLLGIVVYFKGGKVELDDGSDAVVKVDRRGNLLITPGADLKHSDAQASDAETSDEQPSNEQGGTAGRAATSGAEPSRPAATGPTESDGADRHSGGPTQSFTIQNPGGGSAFAVSPDGKRIVTTGHGSPGRFTVWDAQTGQQLSQFTDPEHAGVGTSGHHFSPDGARLIYTANRTVKVMELQSGQVEHRFEFPTNPKLTCFPDRNWAVTLCYERPIHQRDRARVPQRLRIWDWVQNRILYDRPLDYARHVSISPDGEYLIRNRENYHLRHRVHWDGASLSLGPEVKFEHTSRVRSPMRFSPDGRFAAHSLKSREGMGVLLDVATGRIVRYLEPDLARASNKAHEYGASVAFTQDGSQLVTANHLGRIALWNRETGELVREISRFNKTGNHWTPRLAVSPQGLLFIGTDPIRVQPLR